MKSPDETLAQFLNAALARAQLDVDRLAERTKVPRSTLRALLGEDVNALLPGRVYLRGHLLLVTRELGLDDDEVLSRFDVAFPEVERAEESIELPKLRVGGWALAAGLAGAGILAVVLAFSGG